MKKMVMLLQNPYATVIEEFYTQLNTWYDNFYTVYNGWMEIL
jgi:hypothetical protein